MENGLTEFKIAFKSAILLTGGVRESTAVIEKLWSRLCACGGGGEEGLTYRFQWPAYPLYLLSHTELSFQPRHHNWIIMK